MSVRFCSLTPVEAEYYSQIPTLRETVDSVGQMIMDLHDDPIDLDVVLAMNDENDPTTYTLAFSGTTLSMEFSPEKIEILDFVHAEDQEVEVLQVFSVDNVNGATLWLFNQING